MNGHRWAQAVLRLFPGSFREQYGPAFVRHFIADWEEASSISGRRHEWQRRLRLLVEAVGSAALERVAVAVPWCGSSNTARQYRRSALGGIMLDLASAARDLWRSPGYTSAAAITLSAGIGITAVAFTIIESVALRELPYPDAGQLAAVRIVPHDGRLWHGLSWGEFEQLERRTDIFSGVGGIRPNYGEVLPIDLDVTGVDRPEKVQGIEVTTGLLPTLGVSPILGRSITADDRDGDGGEALGYLVSHEYWTRALGADASVIGKRLTVEHRDKTIVGVLPPDIRLLLDPRDGVPVRADLWTRAYHIVGDNADTHYLRTVVRLREDLDLDQARAALAAMALSWFEERPDTYGEGPARIELTPLKKHLTAGVRPLLTALGVAVTLVLLISCANVGSLALARSRARERDLAVRQALGASTLRVARLVLVESLVLAAIGAVGGLALAAISVSAVRALASDVLPRANEINVGAGTVVFTLGATVLAGSLAAGLILLQGRGGGHLVDQLRHGARLAGSRKGAGGRRALTIIQTAVAVVLLVGAGLMLRTVANLARVDLGFDPENVFTFKVEMDQTSIALGPPRYEFFRDVAAEVGRQPEFAAASAIFVLPTHGGFDVDGYGRTVAELEGNDHRATFNVVLPGYFETMRIPLIEGRDFFPAWPASADGEVIIDEQIAERLWPGESALGRSLWIDFDMQNPTPVDRVLARVVAVASHTRQDGIRDLGTPQIYVPHWHRPFWGMNFVGRVAERATVGDAARAVERVVDADVDAIFTHSGRELTSVIMAESHDGRLLSRVLAVFSGLALLLSATGLYGVISYSARQRTQEIGIRKATGARGRDIVWLVVRNALWLSGAGVAVGIAGAIWVTRLLSSLLFGVASADPLTYVVAGGALFVVGVLAAANPALRAAAVDPIQALRAD